MYFTQKLAWLGSRRSGCPVTMTSAISDGSRASRASRTARVRAAVSSRLRERELRGDAHPRDGGEVFLSGAEPPLLHPALDEGARRRAFRENERGRPRRAAEVLRGDRVGGHAEPLHVDRDDARRSPSVRVKRNVELAARGGELLDGLDRSDLGVGVHDGDERGAFRELLAEPRGRNEPVPVDGEDAELVPFLGERARRVQNRVVLDRGDHDPVRFLFSRRGDTLEGEVVGLRPRRGEYHVPGLGADEGGHLLPRPGERLRGGLSAGMHAQGVPEPVPQELRHGSRGLRAHRPGGYVVHVYFFISCGTHFCHGGRTPFLHTL